MQLVQIKDLIIQYLTFLSLPKLQSQTFMQMPRFALYNLNEEYGI